MVGALIALGLTALFFVLVAAVWHLDVFNRPRKVRAPTIKPAAPLPPVPVYEPPRG